MLRQELEAALENIEEFASSQGLNAFAMAFRKAADILHANAPLRDVYHSDLAQGANLPLVAMQLLGAAQAGWVFGGMGSWNDLGFEGGIQDEYIALSDRHFSLLNEAICAASNAGFAHRR